MWSVNLDLENAVIHYVTYSLLPVLVKFVIPRGSATGRQGFFQQVLARRIALKENTENSKT